MIRSKLALRNRETGVGSLESHGRAAGGRGRHVIPREPFVKGMREQTLAPGAIPLGERLEDPVEALLSLRRSLEHRSPHHPGEL
jgi:hypothetical protein